MAEPVVFMDDDSSRTDQSTAPVQVTLSHKQGGLAELPATAICGNDITSSCLYVSALAIRHAGALAPVALLMVAGVLYLFRSIYAEVVGALPLNGGAYNALLNTTSKFRASLAACLTILSYMATAVISGNEAMHYLHALWSGVDVGVATILLLGLFMVLTILGITESAFVAVAIFLTHLATLTLLLLVGFVFLLGQGTQVLAANFATAPPGGVWTALFLGFSAAMLGISGFESSANFVEEQAQGVFPKTLRNMWAAVTVFNPSIAFLALALLPIGVITTPEYQNALLAHMGRQAGGAWLGIVISVDAVLVLSGAVLTSYVGVNGLVHRMTLDRVLPQFLLKRNRRGSTHRILILFFLLCVSVLLLTQGHVPTLAGVYTISFLSVMALFGLGNVLLKVKRSRLPRPTRAHWLTALTGILAVLAGLVGNITLDPDAFQVFLRYFFPAVTVVVIMLERILILEGLLFVLHSMRLPVAGLEEWVQSQIRKINAQQIVFFARGHNVAHLNRVLQYVQENEHTNRLKVVTVVARPEDVPEELKRDLPVLDRAYPDIQTEFVVVEGRFSPALIQKLSREWGIPVNFMFIGSPEGRLVYGLADLGGVRLII